jgi:hypothetical protein
MLYLAAVVLGMAIRDLPDRLWLWGSSDAKAAKQRADEALRKMRESAERYQRKKWKNVMAWR